MKRLRVYIDTSVIGGCLDQAYAEPSRALLRRADQGQVVLVVSELLRQELIRAPKEVQAIVTSLSNASIEDAIISREAEVLRDANLSANVVGSTSSADALHVALATVHHADVIVSWNFRHIVHLEKIRGFNAVNLREGYGPLEIRSPRELVS